MFKKALFLFLAAITIFGFSSFQIFAQNEKTIDIYFFWGQGCPHCEREKDFLKELQAKYPQAAVHDFEIWQNADNRRLLGDLGKKLNLEISGVPFTLVGDRHFSGWYDKESTGKAIEAAVEVVLAGDCRDLAGEIINPYLENQNQSGQDSCAANSQKEIPKSIKVPFFGQIEVKNFSLPALTVILGALDGFNPCAMWTLIFLISLLLGMENRKRMWILGTAFIFTSGLVYFLFMAAWLNFLLFIGFIFWVRLAIGGVALFGGGYNLKEYFSKKPAVCKSSADPKQQKIFANLKAVTERKNFYLALAGIILLAFMVNLVELVCSAGLPAIFGQILALSGLSPWQHYLYILLYVFVFMADDIIVFVTAMITLKMAGAAAKYQRASHLIGGILMLVIGILLIFKPGWLMF